MLFSASSRLVQCGGRDGCTVYRSSSYIIFSTDTSAQAAGWWEAPTAPHSARAAQSPQSRRKPLDMQPPNLKPLPRIDTLLVRGVPAPIHNGTTHIPWPHGLQSTRIRPRGTSASSRPWLSGREERAWNDKDTRSGKVAPGCETASLPRHDSTRV
jgi:hypothetical protein